MASGVKPWLGLKRTTPTVWFFGAGASAAAPDSVPTAMALLRRFGASSGGRSSLLRKKLRELKRDVNVICKRVQRGASPDAAVLEEVFAANEIEAGHRRTDAESADRARAAIRTLESALLRAVASDRPGDAHEFMPHRRHGVASPYAELLERLFPKSGARAFAGHHTLVTLNYDINLDRCLLNMRDGRVGGIDIDYGIELANYELVGGFRRPRPGRAVLLLRLHGSLNWVRCHACAAILTSMDAEVHMDDPEECFLCGSESLDRIVVHPSYARSCDDPVLSFVWGRLQQRLIASRRWVFIGYSLPPEDFHLREVLRHALRVRTMHGRKTPEIIWATVDRGDQESQAELKRVATNYQKLFGDLAKAWKATPDGFSAFVRSLS